MKEHPSGDAFIELSIDAYCLMVVGSMSSNEKGSATCSILPDRPFRRLPALLSVSQLESGQSFLFLKAWRIDRPLRPFQSKELLQVQCRPEELCLYLQEKRFEIVFISVKGEFRSSSLFFK